MISLVNNRGPSGGGKTTFMNALSGRASYGVVTGEVSLNGVAGDTIGKFPSLVGFVPQDDIMHDDLTVYENIMYSARLRLPPSMDWAQKDAVIEDVLSLIGLDKIRDQRVGSPEKRGISGGQKKRVNIGIELVAYPRVLFLDEPTSGLDSSGSLQVGRCLQRFSSLGITVVSVIHQPRISVFHCFTHCLLFARGGRTVFLGPTTKMQNYFEGIGFTMPPGENVADWCIDVVCGQYNRLQSGGETDRYFDASIDLPKLWLSQEMAWDELPTETSRVPPPDVSSDVLDFESKLVEIMKVLPSMELSVVDIRRLCRHVDVEEEMVEAPWAEHPLPQGRADTKEFSQDLYCLCNVLKSCVASSTVSPTATSDSSFDKVHAYFLQNLPPQTPLTAATLAALLVGNSANVVGEVIDIGCEVRHRPPTRFLAQLSIFMSRNVAKFDVAVLLGQCFVAFIGAIVVGTAKRGELNYTTIPNNQQGGVLIFGLLASGCFLYVFGSETLVFERESRSGMSISAYWLAKNIVNLIDMTVVTAFFIGTYFVIVAPDYYIWEAFAVYICLAFYCSGMAQIFAVACDPATALLGAMLVPTLLTSMYGGVGTYYSDMGSTGKIGVAIGPGWYSIETLTSFEVKALPEYVRQNDEIQEMLKTYSYDLGVVSFNLCVLAGFGAFFRLVSLIALYIKIKEVPGGFWCCTCYFGKSSFDALMKGLKGPFTAAASQETATEDPTYDLPTYQRWQGPDVERPGSTR